MFQLPLQTKKDRIVPKNSFDGFLNSKQKKLLTDTVNRIKWTSVLSSETLNLIGKDIEAIQVFELELKQNNNLISILDLIDKFIPSTIIFLCKFEDEVFLSTAKKHPYPNKENIAIVDWRFNTEWLPENNFKYQLNLKISIDYIFSDICSQITGKQNSSNVDIDLLIEQEQQIKQLRFKIERLQKSIKTCKQFNRKVELNLELQHLIVEHEDIISSTKHMI